MNMHSLEPGSRRMRGLDRAFDILEFFRATGQAAKPNEVAQRIRAPRSSVYQLIHLLLENGTLEYAGDDGRIFLGRKLYFLGAAYEKQFDLLRECDRILDVLAAETQETAQLCMLDGNKYVVARMRESSRPFRISSDIGQWVPLPWTASGRLLVAHLSDEEILALIPESDFELPNGKRLDPGTFLAEVRQADRDDEFDLESLQDSFTHCFAVPVRSANGQCIATVCLVCPRDEGARNRSRYYDHLRAAARGLQGMSELDEAVR